MKSLAQWAIRNTPGMNTLMLALMLVGAVCLISMRREVFPEFELEVALVTVPYPGADPDEVETGIVQKVEEAVSALDGIKQVTGIAQENAGSVVIEIDPETPDVRKVVDEIDAAVRRISTFPGSTEPPEVQQLTFRETAVRVAVMGPDLAGTGVDPIAAELRLRNLAEEIRDELTALEVVSQAEIQGAKDYQIDVEIPEGTLRRYGLTLRGVAQTIRGENLDLPGGTIKGPGQDVLVKGEAKGVTGVEIRRIPLVTDPGGVVLTVADLGAVRDDFDDGSGRTLMNGLPAEVIGVQRTADEDLLVISEAVHDFVATRAMPPGYSLLAWDDRSVEVRDRMELLLRNGWQGLVLVGLVLTVFLELRLALWVALGIPISILGAGILLYFGGQTLNMLSMFAFLMVLGILVDDAIVVGENIYTHRMMGKGYLRAAVDGTAEVIPSVTTSVTTTVIAFAPLMFVAGVMGKFIAVLPVTVIACLIISLLESLFILPCHLAHAPNEKPLRERMPFWLRWPLAVACTAAACGIVYVMTRQTLPVVAEVLAVCAAGLAIWGAGVCLGAFTPLFWLSARGNALASRGLDRVITRGYEPLLRWSLRHRGIVVASSVALLLVAVGMVAGGVVQRDFFPDLDSTRLQANLIFPDGTPAARTEEALDKVARALDRVNDRFRDRTERPDGPVLLVRERTASISGEGTQQMSSSTGSHLGQVYAEIVDPSLRNIHSEDLVDAWREEAGEIAGAESLTFGAPQMGPGGKAVEFKLTADRTNADRLEDAVEAVKAQLRTYAGVYDVDDDSRPGKAELQLDLKPDAVALGVNRAELFETVRAAYFGEEVMRVQRGRNEVKIKVRYPTEDRRSLSDFEQIRVRTEDGLERPITELVDITVDRSPSEINRIDRRRSITITADVDSSKANSQEIRTDLETEMAAILADYPGITPLWKGQAEQQAESFQSMAVGMGIALFLMFALLTVEFRSYFQPLLILGIIPFGVTGAVFGHWVMGIPLSFFSMMGIVALAGVVVNDSIVLMDFVNSRIESGMPLRQSLVESGIRRFRPVLLTSATTVAGLIPMLLETSFQAQILVPMATSLAFGLSITTGLVLILLPVYYSLYGRTIDVASRRTGGEEYEHEPEPRAVAVTP